MMDLKLSKKNKIIAGLAIAISLLLYIWISHSQTKNRLIKQLELGDSSLKIKAATEMTHLTFAGSDIVDSLALAINDVDENVRRTAIDSLIRINRDSAVKVFRKSLGSADPGIRMDITEALEAVGSKSALATLNKVEENTNLRYEKARMRGVVDQMRNEYAKEKEKRYKMHKKAYGTEHGY